MLSFIEYRESNLVQEILRLLLRKPIACN